MQIGRQIKLRCNYRGIIAHWLAHLPQGPAAPGSIPSNPEIWSEEKTVDVAEVNQLGCFVESGQLLENVDQRHLVLASGKLVLKRHEASDKDRLG